MLRIHRRHRRDWYHRFSGTYDRGPISRERADGREKRTERKRPIVRRHCLQLLLYHFEEAQIPCHLVIVPDWTYPRPRNSYIILPHNPRPRKDPIHGRRSPKSRHHSLQISILYSMDGTVKGQEGRRECLGKTGSKVYIVHSIAKAFIFLSIYNGSLVYQTCKKRTTHFSHGLSTDMSLYAC